MAARFLAPGPDDLMRLSAQLRIALQAAHRSRRDLRDEIRRGYPERVTARARLNEYAAACDGLRGSARRLAHLWRDTAVNVYLYGLHTYQPAEDHAFDALRRHAAADTSPRRDLKQLQSLLAQAHIDSAHQYRRAHQHIQPAAPVLYDSAPAPGAPVAD